MEHDQTPIYDFSFEHAVIGMAILSEEGSLLKVNRALCELLGCPLSGMVMETSTKNMASNIALNIAHHASEEKSMNLSTSLASMNERYENNFNDILNHAQRMMLANKVHDRMEQSYIHLSGDELWIKVSISIIPLNMLHSDPIHNCNSNKQSSHRLYLQFLNETTTRTTHQLFHSAVHKLIESEQIFHLFIQNLPLSVIITNKGVIEYVNPVGIQLIGAACQEQLIGTKTIEYVEPIDHHKVEERTFRNHHNQSTMYVTYRVRCLDGELKVVEGFSFPITYHGEPVTVGVYKDVTNQKRDDEQMIKSEKLSIAGQLAAGIAHEIRNPLTSINGFLKLLRNTKRNEERFFDIVESELKRIEFIVNELLILSKPSTTNKFQPIEISAILDQVTTLMKMQAAMCNVEITYDSKDQNLWVQAEANLLKQVFINLLKNAIEAMSGGGTITVLLEATENELQIRVIDEGNGIPPEKLQMLGQPFFTTKSTGTGLGLMICFNIIHNHDGELIAESELNVGTTFTVCLPRLKHDPAVFSSEQIGL